MEHIKTVKIIFYLAVSLFIAKPFLGFSVIETNQSIAVHNILAKSFSNRKPEEFKDAEAHAGAIHHLLSNPPLLLLLSITFLLGFIFPLAFKRLVGMDSSSLNDLKLSLVPVQQPYRLSGKLTI
jgi:hypothetical protein